MNISTYMITFHTEFNGVRSDDIVTYINAFYPADAAERLHKSPVWTNVPNSVFIIDEIVRVK